MKDENEFEVISWNKRDVGITEQREIKLFVEGIGPSEVAGEPTITVRMDPDGDKGPVGYVCIDIVRKNIWGSGPKN